MRGSLAASFGLHVAVIVLGVVGLPHIRKPPALPEVPLVVELVTIAEETNVPTRPKEPEPKKEEPKPQPPPKAETPPQTPPKAEPQPEVAVVPPEPKPEPKKAEPKKEEPKPDPKPRPPEELARIKPVKKPKVPQEDFDTVLKNLAKSLPAKPEEKKAEPKAQPKASFEDMMSKALPSRTRNIGDPSKPITMTERDAIQNAIRRAMARCWNVPAGAKDAANLIINVRMTLAPDGSVVNVQLEDSTFGKSDFWRAAADSAIRAVRICSPYSDLPRERYVAWKEITMTFNPREMLGG